MGETIKPDQFTAVSRCQRTISSLCAKQVESTTGSIAGVMNNALCEFLFTSYYKLYFCLFLVFCKNHHNSLLTFLLFFLRLSSSLAPSNSFLNLRNVDLFRLKRTGYISSNAIEIMIVEYINWFTKGVLFAKCI